MLLVKGLCICYICLLTVCVQVITYIISQVITYIISQVITYIMLSGLSPFLGDDHQQVRGEIKPAPGQGK